jgi:hypothetical protein
MAVAYDNPIPGWRTPTVTNLRLWDAEPLTEFDLSAFNAGEYDAVSQQAGARPGCAASHGRRRSKRSKPASAAQAALSLGDVTLAPRR